MKTAGQAAYNKYVELRSASTTWEMLRPEFKQLWEAIAEAAINQHVDTRDAIEQAYEDPEGLGPIARDMEAAELAKLRESAEADIQQMRNW